MVYLQTIDIQSKLPLHQNVSTLTSDGGSLYKNLIVKCVFVLSGAMFYWWLVVTRAIPVLP